MEFCNTKNRTPIINQSFIVYEFTCPCCKANYVRKTERTLYDVLNTHGVIKTVLSENHVNQCVEVQYLINNTSLGPALFSDANNTGSTDNRNSCINLVIDNTKIIDRYKNFNILLFKEAIRINETNPTLNTGVKASKELQLF